MCFKFWSLAIQSKDWNEWSLTLELLSSSSALGRYLAGGASLAYGTYFLLASYRVPDVPAISLINEEFSSDR
jgi:hypothetical protein